MSVFDFVAKVSTSALAVAALLFLLVLGLINFMLKSKLAGLILDRPNSRSLHSIATPRTGGLAIMSVVLPVAVVTTPEAFLLIACTALLCCVSFIDDRRGLAPSTRLLVQFAAATAFVASEATGAPLLLVGVLVLVLVWMTNLYNFMDGVDGLAGGMAVWGFASYAVAAWIAHDIPLVILCAGLVGAVAGFLWFNFPRAQMFLGDAGSIPLGFLAGGVGVSGYFRELWPSWFPLLVFSPFIVDATATLFRRALQGKILHEAHREHYYQRAVLSGFGATQAVLVAYCIMVASSVSALFALRADTLPRYLIFGFWFVLYLVLLTLLPRIFSRRARS